MASASPLAPTFYGHIASTQDALMLFEACLSGALNHVARRPHDRERVNLIKSGNVFIYEEHSSGIKRWTDGVPWSPSRILGNFLVYRELERPFPPGEKKRAMKRSKRSPGINKPDPYPSVNNTINSAYSPVINTAYETSSATSLSKETERSLIGSLVDSYGFKEEGLVKKTVSVTIGGVSHHLVSYYTVADVMNNKFTTPSKDPRFQHIVPRQDLISKQNFRTPIDEVDSMDRIDERTVYAYPYAPRNGYEMTNQSISRPLPLPTPPLSYSNSSAIFGNYSVAAPGVSYETLATAQANPTYATQFAATPGIYTTHTKTENYELGGYRQQRYNSVSSVPSDLTRGHMPAAAASFARRSSNYEQASSIDSGISTSSSDSKLTNDSGYSSQGYFSGLREPSYAPQRSLPTPTQASYDRAPAPIYHAVDGSTLKDTMWSMGNVSAGHGHFMNTPQQWASTGTS
ncbi:BgTH12-02439 [Blumeria graminis f. sp. triticale]|uniref:Bgt-3882 n=3 Tax=Blumeria graminis TaxID=34373 RepID=A0A061HFA8_BLUGR|nr:hypothetical protein BGT96224_3882 [Blumeria graminis f. sp. tritici 96224]CAD6502200.1 BgTH12-02439 [Blumeria graminis f. sp. triticale]VDB86236.1 Bgt-3882 [Blumeria graminis f. sp. tritici]